MTHPARVGIKKIISVQAGRQQKVFSRTIQVKLRATNCRSRRQTGADPVCRLNKKVLIIDDQSDVQMIIEETLKCYGFATVLAGKAKRASKWPAARGPTSSSAT